MAIWKGYSEGGIHNFVRNQGLPRPVDALRGLVFTHEVVREREAQIAPIFGVESEWNSYGTLSIMVPLIPNTVILP